MHKCNALKSTNIKEKQFNIMINRNKQVPGMKGYNAYTKRRRIERKKL